MKAGWGIRSDVADAGDMASALREMPDDVGGMAARIRAFDWSRTPLGPMESWPDQLRFAVSLCERSGSGSAVYWGPDLTVIYNDAFADMLGDRRFELLGRPAREVWRESWNRVGPQLERVLATVQGVFDAEQMVPVTRDGVVDETYWTYSFTPLVGEDGAVHGVLGHRQDVTRAIRAERRLSFQMTLADRLHGTDDPEEIKRLATELLGRNLHAARVGYGEVDADERIISVRQDWRQDQNVPSLAGLSEPIAAFGANALEILRAGEPLRVADLHRLPRLVGATHAANWSAIGVRSLILVPLVREATVRAVLFIHEAQPRAWTTSDVDIARDAAARTWDAVDRAQAEQLLRESEDHYRHAVELNPQVSWTALPDGQLNRVAARWEEWTGSSGLGDSWAEGLHPDDRSRTFEAWSHSIATGDPYDIEHRVQRRDGTFRWARSRAYPRRTPDGDICLWYGTTEDIHERKAAEDRQRLLINELNHRVKNTLATVQAIAFQTLKGDIPLAEARGRFEARLQALSRAHNLLTEQSWGGARLDNVVSDATESFAGNRSRIAAEGEPIWLGPRAALALALALHELGTNAVKYGALANETGCVSVRWTTTGDRLTLIWKERGGPPVAVPETRGFGSRLIERGLAADLGGTARISFDPEGISCRIEAALEAVCASEVELG